MSDPGVMTGRTFSFKKIAPGVNIPLDLVHSNLYCIFVRAFVEVDVDVHAAVHIVNSGALTDVDPDPDILNDADRFEPGGLMPLRLFLFFNISEGKQPLQLHGYTQRVISFIFR